MTSLGSSYKFSHSLKRRLKSSWWLATIMTLAALLAGPILTFFLMRSATLRFEEGFRPMPLHDTLIYIFKWEAFIGQYLLAIVFGVVLATLFMAYQHQKKQNDFYHSLPLRREQLLSLQAGTAFLLQFLVTLVTVLLIYAVSALFLGLSPLPLRWVLIHFLQIMLFFMASFSLTLLAGQLTGHLLAQLELTLIFQLGLPLLALVFYGLCTLSFPTFGTDSRITSLAKASLPSALVDLGGTTSSAEFGFSSPPFIGTKYLIGFLLTFILASGISVFLYLRRPSERAESTFIYPVWAYPVKAFLMFCGALLAGTFFSTAFQRSVLAFIIGALITAILIHILTEMAFQRSVRAANRHIPSSMVILIFTFAVFGIFHNDLLGYDKYIPPVKKIQTVQIRDPFLSVSKGTNPITIDNPDDIAKATALIKAYQSHTVKASPQTNTPPSEKDAKQAEYHPKESFQTSLNLTWHKKFFSNQRNYMALYKDVVPEVQALYDSPTFQEALWRDLQNMKPEQIESMALAPRTFLDLPDMPDEFKKSTLSFTAENKKADAEWIGRFLMAIQADVKTRRFDQLSADPVAHLIFSIPAKVTQANVGYSRREMALDVFPSDAHALALIAELQKEGRLLTDDEMIEQQKNLHKVTFARINKNNEFEDLRAINDMNTIRDLLKNRTVSYGSIRSIGKDIDPTYCLRLGDGSTRYFIKGQVPDTLLPS